MIEDLKGRLQKNITWLEKQIVKSNLSSYTRGIVDGYKNVLWWITDMEQNEIVEEMVKSLHENPTYHGIPLEEYYKKSDDPEK